MSRLASSHKLYKCFGSLAGNRIIVGIMLMCLANFCSFMKLDHGLNAWGTVKLNEKYKSVSNYGKRRLGHNTIEMLNHWN